MGDFYRSYEELSLYEKEGEDYEIVTVADGRDSRCVVMAPHGGKIEPCTLEIADGIAANKFTLYGFKGTKKKDNWKLHLTSHRFDEPRAIKLAETAEVVLALHGERSTSHKFVMVGGQHRELVSVVQSSLKRIGVDVRKPSQGLSATHPKNICNRAQRGGVQLEISRQLRDALADDEQCFRQFTDEIHNLLHRETRGA